MKMKAVTLNREIHKWTGVVLSLFLVIISLTGWFLIHKKSLESFKEIDMPSALIPGLYEKEMRKKGKEIEAIAITAGEGAGPMLLAGTKGGLTGEKNGVPVPVSRLGGVEIKSLLLTDSRWLAGTKRGLYESLDKGAQWAPVKRGPFEKPKRVEIKILAQSPWNGNVLWAGSKKGLYQSADGGESWEKMSHILPMEKESRDLTTIAFDPNQERTFFGTHNGLFSYQSGAEKAVSMSSLSLVAAATVENPEVSLEKYLDMLHTGKLFGDELWILYDLTAVAMVLFVGTGLYIWLYPTLAKRRKKKAKVASARVRTPKRSVVQAAQSPSEQIKGHSPSST
ncbi:MAG: PepSY domain-containing protein [Nitrospiria bacterium]